MGGAGAGEKIELGFRCGGTTVRGTASVVGFHSSALTARWGTALAFTGVAPAAGVSAGVAGGTQGGATEEDAARWFGARRIWGRHQHVRRRKVKRAAASVQVGSDCGRETDRLPVTAVHRLFRRLLMRRHRLHLCLAGASIGVAVTAWLAHNLFAGRARRRFLPNIPYRALVSAKTRRQWCASLW
jgi:hypothetical protein